MRSTRFWLRGKLLAIPALVEKLLMTFDKFRLNVQSLPEANFRQLLALLPLSQRIRSAELVSKRWRQALRDQEVLSVVDFASDPLWRNQVSTV